LSSIDSAGRAIEAVVHLELLLGTEGCLIEETRVAVKALSVRAEMQRLALRAGFKVGHPSRSHMCEGTNFR